MALAVRAVVPFLPMEGQGVLVEQPVVCYPENSLEVVHMAVDQVAILALLLVVKLEPSVLSGGQTAHSRQQIQVIYDTTVPRWIS
jgi:hypothetical protein